jgi:hypothetical protein
MYLPSLARIARRQPRQWLARLRARLFGLAGAMLLSTAALAADAPASPAARGSWHSHKYSFQFLGFTSTYSCDGLASKLKELLLAAGARADAKSKPGACAAPFGQPDKFARADLSFSTLAPLDAAASNGKSVNGTWKAVILAAHTPRDLQIGDCEMVEQFRQQVLPMFTTRNVVSNTTCIPNQESGSLIDLKFDSFAALPAAGAAR